MVTAILLISLQAQINLLENPKFESQFDSWRTPANSQMVSDPDGQFANFKIPNTTKQPWDYSLGQVLNSPLDKDQSLKISVVARSRTRNKINAMVELGKEPYTKFIEKEIQLTPDWKLVEFAGNIPVALSAGQAQATLHLGYSGGEIELKSFSVYGQAKDSNSSGELVNLLANSTFSNDLISWGGSATPSFVSESGAKFARFSLQGKPLNPFDVLIAQTVNSAISANSTVKLKFVARSTTRNRVNVMLEQAREPYEKFVSREVELSPDWKEYTAETQLESEIRSGESQVTVHLGYGPGVVEFRSIELLSNGAKVAPLMNFPQEYLKNNSFESGVEPWFTFGVNKPRAELIEISGQPFNKAVRINVQNDGNPWDAQFGQELSLPSRSADTMFFEVWLRSPDKVQTSFVYELNQPPHTKEVFESINATAKWTKYSIPFKLQSGFGEKQSQFKFFLVGKGVVEIGPMSLSNRGPNVVNGSLPMFLGGSNYESDPAWIKEANQRIEKIRKGDLRVVVLDAKGRPIKNAKVTVNQVRSQFKFGTAVPADHLLREGSDFDQFRNVVKKLFNTVTFENDLKWQGDSPGIYENRVYPAQDWLKKNNIDLRGHNLVWGSDSYLPSNVKGKDKETTWKLVEERVKSATRAMKAKVYLWDVVNEAVTETSLWEKIGWDKFAEVYKLARQSDPNARLCYNDFNISTNARHRDTAIERANLIKKYGAPVDVFGDQSHLSAPGVSGRKLWETWDVVHSRTGLPIEITELDFSTFEDEFQRKYMADFYRAAFSHPALEGVILWGFWQKAHWLSNRGGHLINENWTWRPAMKEIERLITKDWRTSVTVVTDSKGVASVRGFYGDYEISTGKKLVKVKHVKAGTQVKL